LASSCVCELMTSSGSACNNSTDTRPKNPPLEEKNLWIGNIDKRLTEYNLLKILQKYGEVKKFEYLFHKIGPHRGEPRGYCFVEYATREEAQTVLHKLNGKLALSNKLVVNWAHKHQERDDEKSKEEPSGSGDSGKSVSRQCKISAIEAKLKMMDKKDYNAETVVQGKHPLLVQKDQNTRPHPYNKKPHGYHRTNHKK